MIRLILLLLSFSASADTGWIVSTTDGNNGYVSSQVARNYVNRMSPRTSYLTFENQYRYERLNLTRFYKRYCVKNFPRWVKKKCTKQHTVAMNWLGSVIDQIDEQADPISSYRFRRGNTYRSQEKNELKIKMGICLQRHLIVRTRYPDVISTMMCMDNLTSGGRYHGFNGVEKLINDHTVFIYSFKTEDK